MSVAAAGYGAAVDLYTTGSAQRIIAAVAGSGTGLSAQAQTPVIELDFQPEITHLGQHRRQGPNPDQ